jgi:hypothetical protein
MGLFTNPSKTVYTTDAGPAVTLKPSSKWKKFFRRRKRSLSLQSALTAEFSRIQREEDSSNEDLRVLGHVQEIKLNDEFSDTASESGVSESMISEIRSESLGVSSRTSTITRRGSVETLSDSSSLKRDFLSGRTVCLDALDTIEQVENGEVLERVESKESVYEDALTGEEKLEVKQTMEITVVAEVHDGIACVERLS